MTKIFFSLAFGGALLLSPLGAHAQSPIGSIISYQGQLTGTGGAPVADGTTSLNSKSVMLRSRPLDPKMPLLKRV